MLTAVFILSIVWCCGAGLYLFGSIADDNDVSEIGTIITVPASLALSVLCIILWAIS